MKDPTAAERGRRYRARKAGRLPPLPICKACGCTIHRDPSATLCWRCWQRLTEEGRASLAARVARSRARRRQQPEQP